MMSGYGFGGGLGMGLWWIVIVALLVAVAVFVTRRAGDGGAVAHESPRDVLDRRYASGEIDRKEYEQMKRDLAA